MDFNFPQMPEELRQRYLDRRAKDVAESTAKLPLSDWAYFERLGHQLKGNAASYGYEDLGQIGARIEIAATQKDLQNLQLNVEQFKFWYRAQTQAHGASASAL